jgi:hypothetical protein
MGVRTPIGHNGKRCNDAIHAPIVDNDENDGANPTPVTMRDCAKGTQGRY